MLGNFEYSNPTKLYFGKDSLNYLSQELAKYGKNVMLAVQLRKMAFMIKWLRF